MAGGRNRLTATAVKKRKAKGRMIDGAGLILNITASGSKSWVFRYTPKANCAALAAAAISAVWVRTYVDEPDLGQI